MGSFQGQESKNRKANQCARALFAPFFLMLLIVIELELLWLLWLENDAQNLAYAQFRVVVSHKPIVDWPIDQHGFFQKRNNYLYKVEPFGFRYARCAMLVHQESRDRAQSVSKCRCSFLATALAKEPHLSLNG